MDEITNLKNAIKQSNLLEKYHLEKIGIFGSFARREQANDIDFYIEANNCKLSDLKELKTELENITNKKIDIMLKKYANPIVLYRALKDMIYVSV